MELRRKIRIGREDLNEDPAVALQQILRLKVEANRGQVLFRYKPHKEQLRFHWKGCSWKIRFFFGGNRTGKTVAGGAETTYHLLGEYPSWWRGKRFERQIRCWVCSETAEVTRDVAQKMLLGAPNELGTGLIPKDRLGRVTMKRGTPDAVDTVRVRHSSGRWSILQFKAYDQKRAKFQGTSRHLVWCDEEPPYDVFQEIRMRTMDVEGHILLTMTPLKGMSDVCMLALGEPPDPEAFFVLAGWQDNPFLSSVQIEVLRKALKPHEREAREHGRPTVGAGKIYPFPRSLIEQVPFEIPGHWPRGGGMDFGWTNPTANLWGAYDEESDIAYIYSEHYLAETPPIIHAEAIKQRGDWIPIFGDPSGQASNQKDGESLFDSYANHGVYIIAADKDRDTGILDIYERMQSGRLKVFNNLLFFFREFDLYARDEKGKVVDKYDHLMDALRYMIRNIFGWSHRPYGGITSGSTGGEGSYDEEFGGF